MKELRYSTKAKKDLKKYRNKIEIILKNFTPSVKRFTIEELEERALKSEKAIEKGQVYTINDVRNKLGL